MITVDQFEVSCPFCGHVCVYRRRARPLDLQFESRDGCSHAEDKVKASAKHVNFTDERWVPISGENLKNVD